MAATRNGPDSTMVNWECDDYVHVCPPVRVGTDTIQMKRPGVFTLRASPPVPRKPNRAERRRR